LDINVNFDFSASEDQVTFDEIRDELTHSYDIPYLSNRLPPNLEQFAFKPRLRHPCLPRLWYNNCNESYNNVIKRDTKWVIIIGNIFYRSKPRGITSDEYNSKVDQLNRFLHHYFQDSEKVNFWQIRGLMRPKKNILVDGVHLNEDAIQIQIQIQSFI
jgi:hypothetical protein